MGILSGLSGMGLGNLEGADIYAQEEEKQDEASVKQGAPAKRVVDERDFIFDKSYTCPVCGKPFKEKKVKSGKARTVSQDRDLRVVYMDIDPGKYDTVSCPTCGYSAVERYFPNVALPQIKLIRESISANFTRFNRGDIISYDEAIERYKLTLANCIVKKAKDSEKAYVCLKMAWIIRGYYESLDKSEPDYENKKKGLMEDENELLHNALEGFKLARSKESTPIAGMDSVQLDYLLSVLCLREERLEEAAAYVGKVLVSKSASSRLKNNALDIKAEILEKRK